MEINKDAIVSMFTGTFQSALDGGVKLGEKKSISKSVEYDYNLSGNSKWICIHCE